MFALSVCTNLVKECMVLAQYLYVYERVWAAKIQAREAECARWDRFTWSWSLDSRTNCMPPTCGYGGFLTTAVCGPYIYSTEFRGFIIFISKRKYFIRLIRSKALFCFAHTWNLIGSGFYASLTLIISVAYNILSE